VEVVVLVFAVQHLVLVVLVFNIVVQQVLYFQDGQAHHMLVQIVVSLVVELVIVAHHMASMYFIFLSESLILHNIIVVDNQLNIVVDPLLLSLLHLPQM
jgi:hypothetical protein